ncbi:MAG: hypothetical protein M3Z37_01750, partial [Candidatus Eremiobacteraeota bacterium]|nr:hypothetical protein [Candidatus Eremiobacteraeota bacterium]
LDHFFQGPVTAVTFGDAQYRWHSNGPDGFADPDGPEVSRSVGGGKGAVYVLPCSSITVLSGRVR